ncbi:hypothetical protein L0337_31840 [candidate division KSB1 bacterium]|nr:hypothetical protein [candidate division KSB1 bacterium]
MATKEIAFRGWALLAEVLGNYEDCDPFGRAVIEEIAPGVTHITIVCDLIQAPAPQAPPSPPPDPQAEAEAEMYQVDGEDIPF